MRVTGAPQSAPLLLTGRPTVCSWSIPLNNAGPLALGDTGSTRCARYVGPVQPAFAACNVVDEYNTLLLFVAVGSTTIAGPVRARMEYEQSLEIYDTHVQRLALIPEHTHAYQSKAFLSG